MFDDNCTYNSANQNKKLFFVEIQESDLTARTCYEENGKYYFEDKDDRQYQNCEIKKDAFQIESFYRFIFILVMRMLKKSKYLCTKTQRKLLSYAGPLFEPNYLFLKESMTF